MDDDVGQGAVPGQQAGRDEGQARVLHPSEREGGRHEEHVVPSPHVGAEEFLSCCQKFFDHPVVLLLGSCYEAGLSPHPAPGSNFCRNQISDGQSYQIGRDGVAHLEEELIGASLLPGVGTHHSCEAIRDLHEG